MFDDLTVVIKTILRYHALDKCIKSIREISEDLKIIVIDDTPFEFRKALSYNNVTQILTEPDIGLSAGRNLGFELTRTKYIMYTDDDHLIQMSKDDILENLNYVKNGICDLVGSESAMFVFKPNNTIICERFECNSFQKVDLTSNFYISSREFLLSNKYLESCKVNGEHFAFFYNVYKKNGIIYTSPTMKFKNVGYRNPEYSKYRSRSYKEDVKEHFNINGFYWTRKNLSPS